MLNPEVVIRAIDRFSLMPFFPQDDGAKRELARILGEMCSTDEQVSWLARRVPKLHKNWPGEMELRATLCSKFRPKDGYEIGSDVYTDGIPSEIPERNYELLGPAKEQRQIAGEVLPFTGDSKLDSELSELSETVNARAAAMKSKPIFAFADDDKWARYQLACACGHTSSISVPKAAQRFACPGKCGAAYDQWQTVSGSWRIVCVSAPVTQKAGAA